MPKNIISFLQKEYNITEFTAEKAWEKAKKIYLEEYGKPENSLNDKDFKIITIIAKKIPTGIEICEIQLYHLANRIRTTEINEEVSNYLPAINDVLEGLDRDELIQKIVSVEFTRFFNYYSKTKDLNSAEPDRGERRKGKESGDFSSDGSVRYL